MDGWGEVALAFLAFFASHSLPLRPAVRAPLAAWMGPAGFGIGYSILSLGVLAWLISAVGRAPFVELWPRLEWQGWVPVVAMLPACMILALGLGRPNPLSFGGGRNHRFDPARPGLIRWVRHPVLAALALWSAAHMVPNGDLAHVLLFGTFALFAVLGGRLVDRRARREMGAGEWQRTVDAVRRGDGLAGWGSPAEIALRTAVGLAGYVALILLHPPVLGVEPLP